jgi:hypothetical protein
VVVDPTSAAVAAAAAAPLTCSKCSEATLVGQDFHSHILICGGLKPWDISPSKRKRRKGGHGGGLKSTVRMIQKSGQSRDNTDTGSFLILFFYRLKVLSSEMDQAESRLIP